MGGSGRANPGWGERRARPRSPGRGAGSARREAGPAPRPTWPGVHALFLQQPQGARRPGRDPRRRRPPRSPTLALAGLAHPQPFPLLRAPPRRAVLAPGAPQPPAEGGMPGAGAPPTGRASEKRVSVPGRPHAHPAPGPVGTRPSRHAGRALPPGPPQPSLCLWRRELCGGGAGDPGVPAPPARGGVQLPLL